MDERQQKIAQLLESYLGDKTSGVIKQFFKSLASHFDDYVEGGKFAAMNQFSLRPNKKQKMFALVKNLGKDVVSFFAPVPTNSLGYIVDEGTDWILENARRKGYENLSKHLPNRHHMRLISLALTYGLLQSYGHEAIAGKVTPLKKPDALAKKAVKMLLSPYKKESQAYPQTQSQFLKQLLEEACHLNILALDNQAPLFEFQNSDYETLLLFASDGLDLRPFGHAINQGYKLEAMEDTLDNLTETLNSRVAQPVIVSRNNQIQGNAFQYADGAQAPRIVSENNTIGGSSYTATFGQGADRKAKHTLAEGMAKAMTQPNHSGLNERTRNQPPVSQPDNASSRGQQLGGQATKSRLVHTLNDIKDKDETQEERVFQKKTSTPTPH